MKLFELRQIIKEELEGVLSTEPMSVSGVPQMGRIGAYYELVDDWKEKILALPNKLSNTKQNIINRIETIIKTQGETNPVIDSNGYRTFGGTPQEFNNLINDIGIFNFAYRPAPKEKPVSSGVRGRIPIDVNVKLDMVLDILNKFKAGETLTDAEKRLVSRVLSKNIAQ
jgi:hypothetical protein